MAKRLYGGSESDDTLSSKQTYEPKSIHPKKTSKKTYIICGSITGVLFIIAIVFGILAYRSNKEEQEVIQMWDNIRDTASDDFVTDLGDDSKGLNETEGYSTDPMDREIDIAALKDINKDVLCWIYVPGTNVDYPVLQEQKYGESYYLHHNIYKVSQSAGCIFTPAEVAGFEGEDAHFLIFGHRMQNKSMFATLVNYKEEEFYTNHPYIYLYYEDHTERWSIFSTAHVKQNSKIYDLPYFYNTIEYEELIKDLFDKALYKTNISDVKSSKRVLTLSTCDDTEGTGVGRFTVNAVLDKSMSIGGVDLLDNVNHSIIPQANGTNIIIEEDGNTSTGNAETLYQDSSDSLNIQNR